MYYFSSPYSAGITITPGNANYVKNCQYDDSICSLDIYIKDGYFEIVNLYNSSTEIFDWEKLSSDYIKLSPIGFSTEGSLIRGGV